MSAEYIRIKGAREHNLKNIDINIPRDQLVVVTGLSVRASRHWRLTRFMPRGKGAMSVVGLCPAVSRADGKAGYRFYRRVVAGDFD